MAKKKKNERWLILLIVFAVLAVLLYQGRSGGSAGGLVPSGSPDGGDKCCCDTPFAFIVGVKGECKCMTCPQLDDSIIIMPDGSICCTSEDCASGDVETPTTTTLQQPCESITDSNQCTAGYCSPGYECGIFNQIIGDFPCGCYSIDGGVLQ